MVALHPERVPRGRARECETLDRLLEGVRAHRSQVVVLCGEAGIGKTTLLDYIEACASGCHISRVVTGADVVVDVSNSPSFDGETAMKFFQTSTRNILAAEVAAGVRHHVALSVVGIDRLADNGYFRAKLAQEELIRSSSIPYSIVHATQFFEFLKGIADDAMVGNTVCVAPVMFQPMAAEDVARTVCSVALGTPINGIVETAGPQPYRLDEFVRVGLRAQKDPREVVTDPQARYFGSVLSERSLMPGDDARIGQVTFQAWQQQQAVASRATAAQVAAR